MKRLITAITLSLVLASNTVGQQGTRITEDDPRWDCHTMGNKICGPNAPRPVYTCGALTKKHTACKRRVTKQGARCWQHRGAR